LTHIGRWSRADIWLTSSWAEVAPRMMLTRLRSMCRNDPRVASSMTRLAAMSPSSCEESVAGTMLGGTPNSMGSKSIADRNPPRRA